MSPEMKRSKNDQLASVVDYYLRRRNFQTQKWTSKSVPRCCNLREMVTNVSLDSALDSEAMDPGHESDLRQTSSSWSFSKPGDEITNHKRAEQYLRDVIGKVSNEPPSVPSICFGIIQDRKPTFARVSSNLNSLAACFETSDIHLWSLTSQPIRTKTTTCTIDGTNQIYSFNDTNSFKRVFRGHRDSVHQIGFVPSADLLLSCSSDTTLRSWKISENQTGVYYGHDYPVWCLDINNLGLHFVSGSKDTTARLWSITRSHPLRIYAGHSLDIDAVKFHPNSQYLATSSADRTVRLWSATEAKAVRVFTGHRGSIYCLAFSPDGKLLAAAGEDRKIRIWDIGSGALLRELNGHSDIIYSLSFNESQTMLASCGLDQCLKIWDISGSGTSSFMTTARNSSTEKEGSEFRVRVDHENSDGQTKTGPSNTTSNTVFNEVVASFKTKYSLLSTQFLQQDLLFTIGAK